MAAPSLAKLTIILGRSQHFHHHSTALEIVRLARRRRMAGATVLVGVEGYGSSHRLHTVSAGSLAGAVSFVVVVVDDVARLAGLLEAVTPLVQGHGTVVVEEVEAVSGWRPVQP
ncbi:MAG TPA: DUF190 domain-containing protein [Acidimicrobiales bacterium]|nr:DUF190 domain-containing protein [Acidimicrobiales bacterium]